MYGTQRLLLATISLFCLTPQMYGADSEESAEVSKVAKVDEAAPTKKAGSPTHKQALLIDVNAKGLSKAEVKCFCLGQDEALLAGCIGGANEIRVFDAKGAHLKSIELPVAPEAINLAPDQTILVAGEGKLVRLSPEGKQLALVDSPHVADLNQNEEKLREEVVKQHEEQFNMRPQMIEAYNGALEQMKKQDEQYEAREKALREKIEQQGEAKDKKLASQLERLKRQRKTAAQTVKQYKQQVAELEKQGDEKEPTKLTDEQIAEKVKASIAYKQTVASISASHDAVFIACNEPVGYGYGVWRITSDLTEGKKIVSGLSGCCGQMDVQANDEGVFVAENSRHRVCHYDGEGELIKTWGKGARTGIEGFGSCCNPMNLAFGTEGVVYTAEDTTGRIKRYSTDGKLLSVVGSADVVPGCKKVAIGVAAAGDRVYMLDITRNHIAALDRVSPDPDGPIADEDSPVAEGSGVGGALLRVFGLSGG